MLRYFSRVGIALSVLLNVLLGGASNQTFSARNWEWHRQGKPNIAWLIDSLFVIIGYTIKKATNNDSIDFSQHCLESWTYWHLRLNIDP